MVAKRSSSETKRRAEPSRVASAPVSGRYVPPTGSWLSYSKEPNVVGATSVVLPSSKKPALKPKPKPKPSLAKTRVRIDLDEKLVGQAGLGPRVAAKKAPAKKASAKKAVSKKAVAKKVASKKTISKKAGGHAATEAPAFPNPYAMSAERVFEILRKVKVLTKDGQLTKTFK